VTNNRTINFASSQAIVVANNISGSGAINQIGSGVTTLGGTNNFTGAVKISAGTLAVEGTLYSGVSSTLGVTVAGGTLAGSGTINGPVQLQSGTIAPDMDGPSLTI